MKISFNLRGGISSQGPKKTSFLVPYAAIFLFDPFGPK